jgi:hypothetical protein
MEIEANLRKPNSWIGPWWGSPLSKHNTAITIYTIKTHPESWSGPWCEPLLSKHKITIEVKAIVNSWIGPLVWTALEKHKTITEVKANLHRQNLMNWPLVWNTISKLQRSTTNLCRQNSLSLCQTLNPKPVNHPLASTKQLWRSKQIYGDGTQWTGPWCEPPPSKHKTTSRGQSRFTQTDLNELAPSVNHPLASTKQLQEVKANLHRQNSMSLGLGVNHHHPLASTKQLKQTELLNWAPLVWTNP